MGSIVDNRQNALKFEFYCIEKHREDFKQEVHHWFNIPDSVLVDSKFVSSHEELRNKRKNNCKLREYGLDGISIEIKDNIKIYHGLQMKLWNNTLCANKLGTFLSVIYNRFYENSNGYLYHTSNLEKTLQKDISIKNRIISIKVDNPYENIINSDSKNNIILRPYQIEAISKLNQGWNGIKSLNVPCGCGKTIIFSEHLKDSFYKNVFIFSPLRFLTEQNLERIKSYLPKYNHLLIDSDGTRDINDIINKLDKNTVYSCTFRSASDIIVQLFNNGYNFDINNTLLIVDEAHNLLNNTKLIELCKAFSKVLLVTATPSIQLESIIGSEVIYNYPFKDAIKDKYICDYEIYFPYIEKNKTLDNIPDELLHIDNNLAKKCLFFINGLLITGSRRAIVYLKNSEECKIYEHIFNEIMNKYHYFKVLIKTITCEVKKDERINIINKFQKDEEEEIIKIILSIRILDEGIDIPKCDSIFISYIGDPNNDIRNIQRICRANRIDHTNINKVSSVFIWCDNINKSLNTLKLFRDNDIDFHKKIRIKYNSYEPKNEKIEKNVKKSNYMLSEYINVHCLNKEELFEIRKEQLFRFCNNYERCIKDNESFEEYKLGKWYSEQKLNIKDGNKNIYNKLSENIYVKKDIDKNIKTFEDYYQCLRCNYTTERSQIIKNHLNKQKKCEIINSDIIKYTYQEIYELSLIKVYKRNNFKCENCSGRYANKISLKIHMEKYCKFNNNLIENDYINNTDITNLSVVSFDSHWNIEHLDKLQKYLLLTTDNKYIKFLKYILKNTINLNVIYNINNSIILKSKCHTPINNDELFTKSIEKMHEQFIKIKNDIFIDKKYIEFLQDPIFIKKIKLIDEEYNDYFNNEYIKEKINKSLSILYESVKEDAKIYNEKPGSKPRF
jgi:superfamily II DNA or RNA helicase